MRGVGSRRAPTDQPAVGARWSAVGSKQEKGRGTRDRCSSWFTFQGLRFKVCCPVVRGYSSAATTHCRLPHNRLSSSSRIFRISAIWSTSGKGLMSTHSARL